MSTFYMLTVWSHGISKLFECMDEERCDTMIANTRKDTNSANNLSNMNIIKIDKVELTPGGSLLKEQIWARSHI